MSRFTSHSCLVITDSKLTQKVVVLSMNIKIDTLKIDMSFQFSKQFDDTSII